MKEENIPPEFNDHEFVRACDTGACPRCEGRIEVKDTYLRSMVPNAIDQFNSLKLQRWFAVLRCCGCQAEGTGPT